MEAGASFDDKDGNGRTRLANERTFLAWWRSSLTAFGVALAVSRLVPELGHHTQWPYVLLGALYAVFGLAMVVYGTQRQHEVEKGIEHGIFVAVQPGRLNFFTVLGVALGIGTLALVVVGG